MIAKPGHKISVQWHITTNCNNKCRHCYMFDEKTFSDERANTLSDIDLLKVLESLVDFENKWNCSIPSISVTGGDPLQRRDWFSFLSAIKAHNKSISLMGNPETMTQKNLELLREAGVKRIQMSLDGLEETHDYFRSPGSFRNAVNKISELEANGIKSEIMFTLYPENRDELIPLIKFLAESTPLSVFRFDIGTTAGNANQLSRNFDPVEIKGILESYLTLKKELKDKGYKLLLYEKVHLFSLLQYIHDNIKSDISSFPVAGGCLAGWYSVSILSDGTVFSCRRLPIKAGKMPEQSFEEIYLGSEVLKKLRRREYYEECGTCTMYKVCRGCPAYVYGITGNPFSKHPLCFKEDHNNNGNSSYPEPGLDTTFEEEFRFITSSFQMDMDYLYRNLFYERDVRSLFLRLMDNDNEMHEFLLAPKKYLNKIQYNIDDYAANTMFSYIKEFSKTGSFNEKPFTDFINKLKIMHLKS
jgi:radical SAM protein with 4Fe4S-binding SPASM domain